MTRTRLCSLNPQAAFKEEFPGGGRGNLNVFRSLEKIKTQDVQET